MADAGLRSVAVRVVAVEDRFVAWAREVAGLTEAEARRAMARLLEGGRRAPLKLDWVGGGFTFAHGAFAEPAVIRRAAGLEEVD